MILAKFRELSNRFVKETGAQVAVIAAYSLLPMMGVVGTAVDYSRGNSALFSLNAAADAAVLNAAAKARTTGSVADTATIKQIFLASAALPSQVTIDTFNVVSTKVNNSFIINLTYTAKMSTVFMNIFGVSEMNLSGKASSTSSAPPYIDFDLMLDNSPSMGLAGTVAGIASLNNLTGCAFACHQANADGTEDKNDGYNRAKANGIKLRIDFVREAVQDLVDTVQTSQAVPNQFRLALHTFSDVFSTLSPMSTNIATVKSKAAAIDIAYVNLPARYQQTSTDIALPLMNSAIASVGDGSSQASPKKFVFIVTDGVQDEQDPATNPCRSQKLDAAGNMSCTYAVPDWNGRVIKPVDPAQCKTMKDRGINIAVLYTVYLPVPGGNNAAYDTFVAQINNSSASGIAANLQQCASPGLFFPVSDSQTIGDAMQRMFKTAIAQTRLTN